MGRRAAPPATRGNHVLLLRWMLVTAVIVLATAGVLALLVGLTTGLSTSSLLTVAWTLAAVTFGVGVVRVVGVGVTLDRRSGLLTVRNLRACERMWVRDVVEARVVDAPWSRDRALARRSPMRSVPAIEIRTASGRRIRLDATVCDRRDDRIATIDLLRRTRVAVPPEVADAYVGARHRQPTQANA